MSHRAADEGDVVRRSVRRELCAAPELKDQYYPSDVEVFAAQSPHYPDMRWRFTDYEFKALRRHGYINIEGGPRAPEQLDQGATFSWNSTARLLCGR